MSYLIEVIPNLLKKYPRAELSRIPTPLHKLSRISKYLGFNIFIKRDDLTGFGLGGNKTRKLDYLIANAVEMKADAIISKKASSFTRNAAIAGNNFGLEVHIVLSGTEAQHNELSQQLFKDFNANLYYTENNSDIELEKKYLTVLNSLKDRGKNVYELHPGGSDCIGALSYINAFQEIVNYSHVTKTHFDYIFHPTGSTGTQAGLLIGQHLSKYDAKNIGIAISQKASYQKERILKLIYSTCEMLNIDFDDKLLLVNDQFIGPGYAIPSKEGKIASKLFADMEGVLLDNVYTAKAAAALMFYSQNKLFNKNENILFIHTGGNSGIFY